MGFLFTKLTRFIMVVFLFYSGSQWLLRTKSYTISPKQFKSIAAKSADPKSTNPRSSVASLTSGLRNSYGAAINPSVHWQALQLGNIDFKLYPLHLSLTEFAVVLGTPFAATGRIGLHWSNSTCTVLAGSIVRQSDVEQLEEKATFGVGANFRHGEFESHVYNFDPETYVACYGRGMVPVSGLWATTSSLAHGEPLSLLKLYYTFGVSVYEQIASSVVGTFNHYKSKATGKSEL